jgi:hypothetical protein
MPQYNIDNDTAYPLKTTPTQTDQFIVIDKDAGVVKKVVLSNMIDGWINVSSTWSYASATTITVPTGAASLYQMGDKIRITQTTVKYFYIIGVADTLLTVTGGSDYSVANAAITVKAYSHASNPMGFPAAFNYTPTGISATNVTLTGRFSVCGRICNADVMAVFAGGITFTTMPTLPIPSSANIINNSAKQTMAGSGEYWDQSAGSFYPYGVVPIVPASFTTVSICKDGSYISASVPITWAAGDDFFLHFSYEI